MKILVTGGAGFIGSTFVHHVVNHTETPAATIAWDRDNATEAKYRAAGQE